MVQDSSLDGGTVTSTHVPTTVNVTFPTNDHDKNHNPKDIYKSYPSDTVAAVTIAVLAVIVIITMLIVFRALRKRQRARRGERLGDTVIPTVTTGVMGTGGGVYANNNISGVPMRGAVRWENINQDTDNSTREQTMR